MSGYISESQGKRYKSEPSVAPGLMAFEIYLDRCSCLSCVCELRSYTGVPRDLHLNSQLQFVSAVLAKEQAYIISRQINILLLIQEA